MKFSPNCRAILACQVGPYEAGRPVVITEYLEPVKLGDEPGYAVEIGPWGQFGSPTDWTVVGESCLALTPDNPI